MHHGSKMFIAIKVKCKIYAHARKVFSTVNCFRERLRPGNEEPIQLIRKSWCLESLLMNCLRKLTTNACFRRNPLARENICLLEF